MSKLKHLILINGIKRSGKDYTANIILSLLENFATSVSYAEEMKEIIADTFGISLEDLEKYKNESGDYGIEILAYPNNQPSATIRYTNFREILQRFGTLAMKKQFGEAIWAKKGVKKALKKKKEVVVISDFRFMNEYEVAFKKSKKKGFKVHTINIYNNNLPEPDNHPSERELSDNKFAFDFYIDNTDQPNIDKQIFDIVESIIGY